MLIWILVKLLGCFLIGQIISICNYYCSELIGTCQEKLGMKLAMSKAKSVNQDIYLSRLNSLFACWVIFSCFCCPLLAFLKLTFSKTTLSGTLSECQKEWNKWVRCLAKLGSSFILKLMWHGILNSYQYNPTTNNSVNLNLSLPILSGCATYNLQQTKISNLAAFSKITNKAWYFMRILCWQTFLMKYHTLFFRKLGKMLQNCLLLQSWWLEEKCKPNM